MGHRPWRLDARVILSQRAIVKGQRRPTMFRGRLDQRQSLRPTRRGMWINADGTRSYRTHVDFVPRKSKIFPNLTYCKVLSGILLLGCICKSVEKIDEKADWSDWFFRKKINIFRYDVYFLYGLRVQQCIKFDENLIVIIYFWSSRSYGLNCFFTWLWIWSLKCRILESSPDSLFWLL